MVNVPDPVHPGPVKTQVPDIVLFETVPFKLSVFPLGLAD